MLDDISHDSLLDELFQLGQQYINSALELCSNNALASIWSEQDTAFQQEGSTHEIKIWAVPAVNEDSRPDVQAGDSYNSLPSHLAEFVTAVQASVDACCVPGIQAKVSASHEACSEVRMTHGSKRLCYTVVHYCLFRVSANP